MLSKLGKIIKIQCKSNKTDENRSRIPSGFSVDDKWLSPLVVQIFAIPIDAPGIIRSETSPGVRYEKGTTLGAPLNPIV